MRPFAGAMVSAVVLIVACGGGSGTPATSPNTPGTPGTPGTPNTPTCSGTGGAVSVVDNSFSPNCMQVTPGSSVTWTFNGTGHNVTFNNSALGGSGNQSPGATYSKNFPTAGTFAYSCTNHAGMTGSVVVQ